MKKSDLKLFALMIILFEPVCPSLQAQTLENLQNLRISLQKRLPSELEKGSWYIASEIQEWKPSETAIIICDMWDTHWCKGAAARVAEMAPFMNDVISIARDKGVLIVHAPSDCMAFYKNHPARKVGQKYGSKKAQGLISRDKLPSEKDAVWPVDQSDGGCDCTPECRQGPPWPWTRQIELIEISEKDAISDSGAEIAGLFFHRDIKNVILMGVHTNMCVIGRSFGLRNMVRLGMNVVLMRDMTDTMYDSKQWPEVNHFTGNSLVNEYIETYVCPTMVSSDLTGKKQFRFKDDKRKIVAFLSAESEYNSNHTLPQFAHELLLTKGVNCEFALGKPLEEVREIHNIENLQILQDADLAVIYIRRRGLQPEGMALIKDYINRGKPVLGIRTASHAFDPEIPEGKGQDFLSGLSVWPEFDKEILGGNYRGHFSNNTVTVISVVPGMENHPLLKDVSLKDFTSSDGIYRNQNLASANAQVILFGTITNQPSQPMLWINNTGRNDVIYTSMGSPKDWKNESFRQIMRNSVSWLLDKSNKQGTDIITGNKNTWTEKGSSGFNTIKKDPVNPHYFNYKGVVQPLIGTGGGNCYGFVVNGNFDYKTFIDTVCRYRVNYVSILAHQLFPTEWHRKLDLAMAPLTADGILQPWAVTDQVSTGGFWPFKFDLSKWNSAYFKRLKEFVDYAAEHDIVVNVFFDDIISQADFNISAFSPVNNINGTENTGPAEYFVMDGHPVMTAYHDSMISKIVRELNYADNVMYFIADEPGIAGRGRDSAYYHKVYNWHSHKIDVIKNTEKSLPKKHPVAVQQQMCEYPIDFSGDDRTDFNVHQYTWWGGVRQVGGLRALDYEYDHNKPLDMNETKNIRKDSIVGLYYPGDQILCQRLDMWSFMLGGGASFLSNNKEFTLSAPGGLHPVFNSRALSEIKSLRDFMDDLPVRDMLRSEMKWLKDIPASSTARGISKEGVQYAMYMHHSTFRGTDSACYYPDAGGFSSGTITINLPSGSTFKYLWIEPSLNKIIKEGFFQGGIDTRLSIPDYSTRPDIVLRIIKVSSSLKALIKSAPVFPLETSTTPSGVGDLSDPMTPDGAGAK